MKKLLNGIEVQLNPDEILEYNERQRNWDAETLQRLEESCQTALTILLDQKAAEKKYTSALFCISYVASTNSQWSKESLAFSEWRDKTYIYLFDYLKKAEESIIINASAEDFIKNIPTFVWP